MQNIWETDEERKRKMQMMGAPLQGIQYQQQQQQPQNIQAQRGPDDVGTTAQKILVARGLNDGITYGTKKIGEGIGYGVDQAKQAYYNSQAPLAPQSQYDAQDIEAGSGDTSMGAVNPSAYEGPPAATDAQYEAQGLQEGYASSEAPLALGRGTPAEIMAENISPEDMTSGMIADASTDAATSATSAATSAATEGAATAATDAVASKAAEASIDATAGSVGGPLSAGLTLAKTGDVGKAAGAGAGTYIGAALGSAFGPIGTFVGSAIGSYVGQYAGGYLT